MELETRECACRCGGFFKVLPTSINRYISAIHEEDAMMSLSTNKPSRGRVMRKYPPGTLSSSDLARVLKVKPQTVYNWIHRGKLTPLGSGHAKYFDLERALEELGKHGLL